MDAQVTGWLRGVAATHDPGVGADTPLETLGAGPDRAVVVGCGRVVAKFHLPRTDGGDLAVRLGRAASLPAFLTPLWPTPLAAPGGRLVTLWPRVEVLPVQAPPPWTAAGALLAAVHRTPLGGGLPEHGGPGRLRRALARLTAAAPSPEIRMLREVATDILGRIGPPPNLLAHGDWHLGQLGRPPGTHAWLLLDIDDLGAGDPAWDLGRPAGFWAAGLLADAAWADFLDSYRAAGGPAVPPEGDPWPVLDLPARAAVLIAATRELLSPEGHSEHTADALVAACARMHHG